VRGRWREVLWVGIGAFLVLLPGAFFGLPNKPMAGAQRVLEGEVIYRDFWTVYAPGAYYATAALLALFGRYVLVQAVAGVALHALAVALFFALLRRCGVGLRAAAALAAVVALALFEIAVEVGTYAGALPGVLAAWLAVVAYAQGAGLRRLFWGGVALGAGAAFKHDVALYAALAACGAIALEARWGQDEATRIRRSAAHAVAAFAAGCAVVPVPLIAWLAWKAGADAWQDLIAFPAGDFRLVRAEPFPGLAPPLGFWRAWAADPANLAAGRDAGEHTARWLLANAPQAAFLLALLAFVRCRRELAPERRALLALALLAMPLFFAAAHVQQNTHLTSLALCAFLAGSAAWPVLGRSLRRVALVLLALWIPGLWLRPVMEALQPLRVWSGWARLDLPVARGVFVSPSEERRYGTVAAFVEANVPPGEPIHAGVVRNDAVVVSDARFYYLVDRPAATRYHELHPGVTDTESVQREMIADLEAERVRCLVLWWFGGRESGDADERIVERRRATGIAGIGSPLLDAYVAERYARVLDVDEYSIYWRKDAGEPVLP
jgi:hypothetical protein